MRAKNAVRAKCAVLCEFCWPRRNQATNYIYNATIVLFKTEPWEAAKARYFRDVCLTLRPILTFNTISLKMGAAAAALRCSGPDNVWQRDVAFHICKLMTNHYVKLPRNVGYRLSFIIITFRQSLKITLTQ